MTGSTYGDLRLWDLKMNQLHAEKNAHDLGVTCCAFAPEILSGEEQYDFSNDSNDIDRNIPN